MKFTTNDGATYTVDLKARTCEVGDGKGFSFHNLTGVYVGSNSVRFRDECGDHILHVTTEVTSVEGSPLEAVTAEEGNVLVLTKNSAYEINQEQKLVRKVAGFNSAHVSLSPKGDWFPYTELQGFRVGQMGLIYYPGDPDRPLVITHIREIKGNLVETAEPGVLAVSVALVKAEIPLE